MKKDTYNFPIGTKLRLIWNGIRNTPSDEIWVTIGNNSVVKPDGSGGRVLNGLGHRWELFEEPKVEPKGDVKAERQTKTVDRSSNGLPNYNVSGWGNLNYKVPLLEQEDLVQFSKKYGNRKAAKKWDVCEDVVWRIVKLHTKSHDDVIKPVGDYDKNFRMRACILAKEHGTLMASVMMGCSRNSIYNWIKAYDIANSYFNPKQ